MVKKITLLTLVLALLLVIPSFAVRHVEDDAAVFENVAELEEKLTELEDVLGYPSFIITTDQPFDQDAGTATDLLLMDRVGRNENGTIFTINMATRDFQFSTSGPDLQVEQISDDDIESIIDGLGDRLKDGDFDGAGIFYYERLRRILGGNYISFVDMVIAAVASLLGVGSYGGAQALRYKRKARVKPFPINENAVAQYVPNSDVLIDSWETVTVISNDDDSSGGGSSFSRSSGGGSFRGGGGKF